MRIASWGLAFLLLLGGLGAAEQRVTIAPGLTGAWVKPDRGWSGRTVLMFHGFASDLDDAGGLFKRTAAALAAKGIASLRINFRGEGDAQRTAIESTFGTRLEDAAAAYAWLVEQPGVNANRVGVLGFSLGASTAIETGAQYPEWFKSMAVWSSPSGNQFAQLVGEFRPAYEQALKEGIGRQELTGWKTVTLRREFFDSLRGVDLDKSLAKYPGAFLTVRGTDDYLRVRPAPPPKMSVDGSSVAVEAPAKPVDPDDNFLAIAPGEPKEKLIVEGGDHIFHVFDGEKGQAKRVIGATVDWFARTL